MKQYMVDSISNQFSQTNDKQRTMSDNVENVDNTNAEDAGDDNAPAVEEESKATFQPIFNLDHLPEIEVKSFEEQEDVLFDVYVS
jgi:hypothetical protein